MKLRGSPQTEHRGGLRSLSSACFVSLAILMDFEGVVPSNNCWNLNKSSPLMTKVITTEERKAAGSHCVSFTGTKLGIRK